VLHVSFRSYGWRVTWDPDRYERFADHRARPGVELISRIPDVDASTIVDLGCGTGHLTALLAALWQDATVVGVDSSQEMIERARGDRPGIEWHLADIASWEPDGPVDVLFSNATLHWLDDHHELFPRLRSWIAPGGVMAVQMPDNWAEPTHTIPAEILDDGSWPDRARDALLRDRLSSPAEYLRWMGEGSVDVWRTTYFHQLEGEDPVWTWVTGSVLRPVLAALDEGERDRFSEVCKERYRMAYPASGEGLTLLPFSRLFLVVRAPLG
jgi:trans-aconitate 2-methyltransferase